MKSLNLAGAFVVMLAFASCRQLPQATTTDTSGSMGRDSTLNTSAGMESDWAVIERLEGEAKAIAITTGCEQDSQCRSAPVGSRACGGPRYYIPYCPLSTDSAALFKKLDEVAKAEQAYNKKYEIVSTCEFRTPPRVGVRDGVCAALPADQ